MARFSNAPPAPRPGPSSLGLRDSITKAVTHEGGAGFVGDPENELFYAAVGGFLTDQFYESGDERIERLRNLVPACDPAWLASFIPWLRSEAKMRSASTVLAVEYGRANFPNRRQVLDAAMQRPDEPGEVLGYWMHRYGRPVPSWLKRGLSDACKRLYRERALLKYDGKGRGWRFGDVIEMIHPQPYDWNQSRLYRYALDRRRHPDAEIPEALHIVRDVRANELMTDDEKRRALADRYLPDGFTWERLAGWVPDGMNAAAWETAIPHMGAFALLRNLNNFDRAGISETYQLEVVDKISAPDHIKQARLMPYNYLTAYLNRETDNYALAMHEGVEYALGNVPKMPGRTLIMVDCSYSMSSPVGGSGIAGRKGTTKITNSIFAGFMATVLARRCSDVAICTYSNSVIDMFSPRPTTQPLRAAEAEQFKPNGGTETWYSLDVALHTYRNPDRILIITDEQAYPIGGGRYGYRAASRDYGVPTITWNIGGYRAHHAPHGNDNHYAIGGYSDQPLRMLPALLDLRHNRWPWEDK